ncbi:MAG: ABC transporter substrate-binding protein [Gammaproteobacteria bacterium]
MERLKQQFLGMFVLIGMLLLPGGPAVQAEPGPEVLLREVTDQVLAEIRKDPEQLKDVARVRALTERFILPHIDFQVASQWVLGKYWRTASGQQRLRFVEEFRQLLLNTYVRSISNYRENRISIAPARGSPASGRMEVDAEIEQPGGPPVHLGFRLHRPETDWLVYDISVEGISLVATHRSSFAKEIHDKGLDSLIDRLASMNADTADDRTGNAATAASAP